MAPAPLHLRPARAGSSTMPWRYTQDTIPVTGMYRVDGEFVDGRSRGHEVVSTNVEMNTGRFAALVLLALSR